MRLLLFILFSLLVLRADAANSPIIYGSVAGVRCAYDLISRACVSTSSLATPITIANGGTNKALTLSAGGIPYFDSDSFEVLAAGASGKVLTSGGAGAPTWETPSGFSGTLNSPLTVSFAGQGNVTAYFLVTDADAEQVIGSTYTANGSFIITDRSFSSSYTELHRHSVDNHIFLGDNGNVGIGASTSTPAAQLHTEGTVRFGAFGAGDCVFDADGDISSSSDERLKEQIKPYAGGGDLLDSVQPAYYHWNKASGLDMDNEYVGFIAQNVLHVPGAVGQDKKGYYSFNSRGMLATVVNAIKELRAENRELRKLLNAPAKAKAATAVHKPAIARHHEDENDRINAKQSVERKADNERRRAKRAK